MSDSESSQDAASAAASDAGEDARGLRGLAQRVHRKLGIDEASPLPVRDHRAAVESLQRAHDILVELPGADVEVRMLLLASGIAVQRRVDLGAEGEELEDLSTTAVLLFVVQVLCEGAAASPAHDLDDPPQPDPREPLERWQATSLWEAMQQAGGWEELPPATVCRACVRSAPHSSLEELAALAPVYFRLSAAAMVHSMLGDGGRDFLTLSAMDVVSVANSERDRRLAAIVGAAESEAGQMALRDILLSFLLPSGVVGVRRGVLLSRESSAVATQNHAAQMQLAHEVAMRGAEWTWTEDKEELHRSCALLAGACVMMASKGTDAIRKGTAFRGRADLPFLEARKRLDERRLCLVAHRNEWVVYACTRVRNQPKTNVLLRQSGFGGLCAAVLSFTGA